MTNTVFELPVIEAMGGDIVLLASPRMCAADLRGDISGQWKEQQLWGRTFSVPVREQFHVREDGATIWDSAGGAVCPPGTFFFDYPGYTDLMADFDIPDPDTFHPSDTFSDDYLRKLENTAKTAASFSRESTTFPLPSRISISGKCWTLCMTTEGIPSDTNSTAK